MPCEVGSSPPPPHPHPPTPHHCQQVAAAEPHVPSGWDPSRQPAEVLLGVLASDVRLAVRSLRDYCQALGLPFAAPESRVS